MTVRARVTIALGLGATLASGPARADVRWQQQAELRASDAMAEDRFGWAVAASADAVFVGAPSDVSARRGAVYVFIATPGRWTQALVLMSPRAAAGDRFGASIASNSTTVVVGAPGELSGSGAAYVFRRARTTARWDPVWTLAPAAAGGAFGTSVALDADGTILVGAPENEGGRGVVYAFAFDSESGIWGASAKLETDRAARGLGSAVALRGDTAIAGAPAGSGLALAYTRSGGTWSPPRLIAAPEVAATGFGYTLAVDGATALIGAARAVDGGAPLATVYSFGRDAGWAPGPSLVNGPGAVAISAGDAIIGASSLDAPGLAYVYSLPPTSPWLSPWPALSALDGTARDAFGQSVAIDADNAVVGAPARAVDLGPRGGVAYVFRRAHANGDACDLGSSCATGFCVDGACCDTACGGVSTTDCQSCVSGTCRPLPKTSVCHVAVDECDQPSVCDGVDIRCPADLVKPNGTTCAAGVCTGGVCGPPIEAGSADASTSNPPGSSPASDSGPPAGCGCVVVGVAAAPCGGGIFLAGALLRALRIRTRARGRGGRS